jgi:hypothetical protein
LLPSSLALFDPTLACSNDQACVVAGFALADKFLDTAPGVLATTEDGGIHWSSAVIVPVRRSA